MALPTWESTVLVGESSGPDGLSPPAAAAGVDGWSTGNGTPRPYRLPRSYLPLPLDPPGVSLLAGEEPAPDRLVAKLLAHAMAEAEETLADLATFPLPPAGIADRASRLRRLLLRLRRQLQPHLDEVARGLDDGTSVAAMTAAGVAGTELELLGNVLQDRYFRIVRVDGFDRRALAAQCCATADALLLDLPFAVLGVEEYSAVFRCIAAMWATLEVRGVPEAPTRPAPPESCWDAEDAWASCWNGAANLASRAAAVAQYRWTAGHHLLDLCFVFGRCYLAETTASLLAGDCDAAAEALRYATIFLRGSTAAMRFAANFPARIYNEQTRPSMDEMGEPLPMGFSGTQNADYITFQLARRELGAVVKQLRPALLTPAFRSVYRELREFREVYLADTEQHILIAASKVGTDTSLMQKASQRELPDDLRIAEKSGTDVLRDLANIRRRDVDW